MNMMLVLAIYVVAIVAYVAFSRRRQAKAQEDRFAGLAKGAEVETIGGLIDPDLSVLRRKGKSRQPKETRGTFRIGTSIAKRLKEVRNRETFGHWELDTVVSSRGKSKGCLATFLERKTRFYLAFKIPDRTAKSMFSAIEQLCKLFPKEALKTFTSDREISIPNALTLVSPG